MTLQVMDCGWCGARNMTFEVKALVNGQIDSEWFALCTCSNCHMCSMIALAGVLMAKDGRPFSLGTKQQTLADFGLSLVRGWPQPDADDAPPDTPKAAANAYEQASKSIKSQSWDASAAMSRKAIDSATRDSRLDPTGSLAKRGLFERIEELAKLGRITEDLKNWAHEVRTGGNESLHEDRPFTAAEARALLDFVGMFLRYAFTLPAMVKKRRAAKGKQSVEE